VISRETSKVGQQAHALTGGSHHTTAKIEAERVEDAKKLFLAATSAATRALGLTATGTLKIKEALGDKGEGAPEPKLLLLEGDGLAQASSQRPRDGSALLLADLQAENGNDTSSGTGEEGTNGEEASQTNGNLALNASSSSSSTSSSSTSALALVDTSISTALTWPPPPADAPAPIVPLRPSSGAARVLALTNRIGGAAAAVTAARIEADKAATEAAQHRQLAQASFDAHTQVSF